MALFMTDQGKRSDLQEKLAAELREKAARTSQSDAELPDGVEDSAYVKNYKNTTSLAWLWVIIGVIILGIIVAIAIIVSQ